MTQTEQAPEPAGRAAPAPPDDDRPRRGDSAPGLFVGSGAVINVTGPAAVLSYVPAGAAGRARDADARRDGRRQPDARLVHRVLPPLARPWAGFTGGWLYWYFWVIVVGFEAVAGASILQRWIRRAAVADGAGPHDA